ncbi:ribonuclease E inhibitor RraB [Alkalimarinus sediminis]|uniref:Ribonuclease E inhibitor RraB n=1 Tax=Alkalimarinus sediminis TaxID=1632866 RepID=A0A9E8KRG9_9ALTE|nr:ribonuclease E inhibitor RraB [Alkalimarinus sediminis]UZW76355.1 ribonuclease E inhibitor RraB [Alkalimarinus sediminis]
MSVVDALLDNAYQDTQLLIGNDEKGDNFLIPRDVDFVLYATDEEKADTVSSFINDNRYGQASYTENEDKFRIIVVVNMPSTQNLICSVSGLMTCIGELFGVEYDGWGCTLENT